MKNPLRLPRSPKRVWKDDLKLCVLRLISYLSTFLSWITKRSSRTRAGTSFWPGGTFWGTNSSGSARSRVTRVRFFNTFLVVANITGAAVGINRTFRSASCDGIGFGDQTSQASANGVSKFVGHTHSSGSTWAWVTRIWFQDASIQKKMIIFVDILIFFDRKALENISNSHKFTKTWRSCHFTSKNKIQPTQSNISLCLKNEW